MTFTPHPIVTTTLARQRGAELQAQANRFRLANLAQGNHGDHRRQPGADLSAIVAVALALALLAAAGRVAAADAPPQVQQDHARAAAQFAAPVLAADDPGTSTVLKAPEAAS